MSEDLSFFGQIEEIAIDEVLGDPKRDRRIKDPELMRQAHWAFDECAICGGIDISIHHVLPRGHRAGGDDVWENLVALCGSGTHGCHGGVEAGLDSVCRALGSHLLHDRPDTVAYLQQRLGSVEAAGEFLLRYLRVTPDEYRRHQLAVSSQ